MSNTVNILAFAPHPDDAEIFCGGLLLKSKAQDYKTGVVDLTKGELGTKGSVETREQEVKNSSAILGLDHRCNLALPDGAIGIETTKREQLLAVVNKIRLLKPEIILAPYWQSRHPDHSATSELLTKAAFYSALKKFAPETEAFSPKQIIYYQMRYSFKPSFLVDISPFAEQKMRAIKCFSSQVAHSKAEQTLVSSKLSLSSIEARDGYFGAMIGVEKAEAYLTKNSIEIANPVEHFLNYNSSNSLFYPNHDQ